MKTIDKAIRLIEKDIANKIVLEVACGCAEFSICASKTANRVECIDLDDIRLRPEIFLCSNVLFRQMDAANMEYTNEVFDTVVVYNAIGHLAAIIENVLNECLRVRKRDGKIYFLSTFKMDKNVINAILLPLLEERKIEFERIDMDIFYCIGL